ncbi:Phosphoenolpyruvate carboxykinase [ATP] [Arachis hypogaea]|nr:Phosphoenolpyruvate carboxykinase [ATP] [Arachis hypogaea]
MQFVNFNSYSFPLSAMVVDSIQTLDPINSVSSFPSTLLTLFFFYHLPMSLNLTFCFDLCILQWPDKKAYNETLLKLAGLFQRNLETFINHKIGKDNKLSEEILAAGPVF